MSIRYRKPVLMHLLKSPGSRLCDVGNVTSQGVRFYTGDEFKPGTVLDVSFEVPAEVYRIAGDNHLKAKVLWQKWSHSHNAYRTGAEFVHVAKSTHHDLTRMIEDAAMHSRKF